MADQERYRRVRAYLTTSLPPWVQEILLGAMAAVFWGMAGFALGLLAGLVFDFTMPLSIGGAIVCATLAVLWRKRAFVWMGWAIDLLDWLVFLVRLALAFLRIL